MGHSTEEEPLYETLVWHYVYKKMQIELLQSK